MVRPLSGIGVTLALLFLISGSCGRIEKPAADVMLRKQVETALLNLSADLPPILSSGSVTSIAQLSVEWRQRYPQAPPLFTTYPPGSVRGVHPSYYLPQRDYFWLSHWSTNDHRSTPLFWSYFHLHGWRPPDDVVYLTIDGTERHCPSNDFRLLLGPLSNRFERAAPDELNLPRQP